MATSLRGGLLRLGITCLALTSSLVLMLACGAETADAPDSSSAADQAETTPVAPVAQEAASPPALRTRLPAEAVRLTRPAPERPRVLLLGLDGADWDVLDPLLELGVLPNLSKLIASGARAELDCAPAMPQTACFCPPVWVSIATGVAFDEHKIGGMNDATSQRKRTTVWQAAAAQGVTSTLVSYRNTWKPVQGARYVMTEPGLDFASFERFARLNDSVTPRMQMDTLRTKPADLFETLEMLPYSGERASVFPMVARDRVAMEATLRLVAIDPTDLLVVLLHAIDKSGHLHWASVQEKHGDPIDADAIREQANSWVGPIVASNSSDGSSVVSQYLEADAWLGELLATVPVEYVVVVSDHGMERSLLDTGLSGGHGINLPAAHQGIFVVSGPGVAAGKQLPNLNVFDVAPTVAHLLGVPVATARPGQVPEAAFEPNWFSAHPIERVEDW